MLNTKIVYILGHQKPKLETKPTTTTSKETSTPEKKDTPKPLNTKIPTEEIIARILSPEYEAEDIIYEDNNRVVKVPYSTDKDAWMKANDKMRKQLGYQYQSKPPRWVYGA